jgi:hypothetical protein
MALATTIPFGGFRVLLETSPGVYAAPCGLTERSLSFSKEVNDSVVPDCADEDAAVWVERDVISLSAQLSGRGLVARESLKTWRLAFESGIAQNARIHVSGTAGEGGGDWVGQFFVTSLDIGTARSSRVNIGIEMLSSGPVQWVPQGSVSSFGVAQGTSTAAASGATVATFAAVGSAAGVGTPTAVGTTTGTFPAAGASAGVGTATAVGSTAATGTGQAIGGLLLILTKA